MSVLLCALRINGKLLNPSDLPELPISSVSAITNIAAPNGKPYELSTALFTSLRRYKAAMSIYLSSWISRLDVSTILTAIQESMRGSNPDYANIELQMATQEYTFYSGYVHFEKNKKSSQDIGQISLHCSPTNEPILLSYFRDTLVKFSFYGSIGTRRLDAKWEENVDKSSLSTLLGQKASDYLVSTTALPGAISMRHSYKLFVEGRISRQDSVKFTSSLAALWQEIESGNMITAINNKSQFNFIFHKACTPVSILNYDINYVKSRSIDLIALL